MKKLKGRNAVARTCVSCHSNDDVHKGAFSTRCERCHTDVSWVTTLRQ